MLKRVCIPLAENLFNKSTYKYLCTKILHCSTNLVCLFTFRNSLKMFVHFYFGNFSKAVLNLMNVTWLKAHEPYLRLFVRYSNHLNKERNTMCGFRVNDEPPYLRNAIAWGVEWRHLEGSVKWQLLEHLLCRNTLLLLTLSKVDNCQILILKILIRLEAGTA